MSQIDRNAALVEFQFADMILRASKRLSPRMTPEEQERLQKAAQSHYDKALAIVAQAIAMYPPAEAA